MSVADEKVNGESCEFCGIEFRKAHGYPVVCKGCWKDMTPEERRQHQQARIPEL